MRKRLTFDISKPNENRVEKTNVPKPSIVLIRPVKAKNSISLKNLRLNLEVFSFHRFFLSWTKLLICYMKEHKL